MDAERYLAVARRWWWLLILGALTGGIAAYLLSRAQTPTYAATATMLVNQAQAVTGPTYNDILANQQLSKTYANLARRRPVLEQVEKNLQLPPESLNGRVTTALLRETQLIEVTVEHPSPAIAAQSANEIAKVFSEQIREAQGAEQLTAERDLDAQIKALQTSIDTASQELAALSRPTPGLSEEQRLNQSAQVTARLESLRATQFTLQQQLQNLRVLQVKSFNSVKLAESATAPDAPVRPRVLLNILVGISMGLAGAALVIASFEYLDDTIKLPSDVRRAADLPVVGAVARFELPSRPRARGRRGIIPNLLTELDSRSPVAEAYRVVRTNLEFAHSGSPYQTMLVTSGSAGEGKSTTAANLALVFAQTGRRVILVDADLRRPSLHRLFDLPNSVGLSTLFVMDAPELSAVLRMTPLDNLLLMPCGPLPPNPAELLSSPRMRQIIELLKKQADFVIFDSPPILGVADSSALAPRLDGTILVVESGRTRRSTLLSTVQALRQVNATLWGVVLNKVAGAGSDEYLPYGYQPSEADLRANGMQPAEPVVGRPWKMPGTGR